MTITTENYEVTHGSKPKPSQDGAWMFFIIRREHEAIRFSSTGTYREALKSAKAEAKLIGGASRIIVLA